MEKVVHDNVIHVEPSERKAPTVLDVIEAFKNEGETIIS